MEKHVDVAVKWLLEAVKLSCNGYYHKSEVKEVRKQEDEKVKEEILKIHSQDKSYYGYRRVTYEFKNAKKIINHKRILRIMGEYFLIQPKRIRRNPHTTNSNHNLIIYPNEIKYLGKIIPGWVWVSDITYVWNGKNWSYVAIVLDIGSRKVVGFAISTSLHKNIVIEALQMALKNHKPPKYHHSDRGVQYCCHDYVNILKLHKIIISMADVGISVDNAYAESFNRSLKVEEVYLHAYESHQELTNSVSKYILCYNTTRLHSSLGYMSPENYLKSNLISLSN